MGAWHPKPEIKQDDAGGRKKLNLVDSIAAQAPANWRCSSRFGQTRQGRPGGLGRGINQLWRFYILFHINSRAC